MSTTKEDIRIWINKAIKNGATHLIVVCDEFDYEDYPVEVSKDQDVKDVFNAHDDKNMQSVMEVYNLSMDIDEQLNKKERVINF